MAGRNRSAAAAQTIEGEVVNVDFPVEAEQPDATPAEQVQGEVKQKSEAVLKREAYTAAEAALKEKYSDEFKALVRAEAEKRGVVYTFRKTDEEKAREQLAALYEKFPNLRPQG